MLTKVSIDYPIDIRVLFYVLYHIIDLYSEQLSNLPSFSHNFGFPKFAKKASYVNSATSSTSPFKEYFEYKLEK